MKRAARQIAVCAGILILLCLVLRGTVSRDFAVYLPIQGEGERLLQAGKLELALEDPERDGKIIRLGEASVEKGYLRVPVHPEGPGKAWMKLRDQEGESWQIYGLQVSPARTVYDLQAGGFTGDTAVLWAVTAFWILVCAIMCWNYFQARGPAYYAYSTIYFAGFSIFALVTAAMMIQITVMHSANPAEYSMLSAYTTINSASLSFMMVTLPAVFVFAIAMAVSNIALLRHERPRIQNALGLAVSLLLIAGEAVGVLLFIGDFSGSEWESRVNNMLKNVYASAFVYFECMLAGSVICGVKAARHRPDYDKDFIIILGCWFRPDGTLPPLLRGRADRALAFWREQKAATGREAVLIPSGGQGRDEPMPEAEAMRRYLLEQNIPERLIRPESQSRNTYQNMSFSGKIMDELKPGGKAVFATTNYHVFRSGVWAQQAGLRAEGIGGRTRWWFWPNAFMRECAGLLQRRWKQELLLLALMMAFFGVLSLVL